MDVDFAPPAPSFGPAPDVGINFRMNVGMPDFTYRFATIASPGQPEGFRGVALSGPDNTDFFFQAPLVDSPRLLDPSDPTFGGAACDDSTSCNANVFGFFGGTDASDVGINYNINGNSSDAAIVHGSVILSQ